MFSIDSSTATITGGGNLLILLPNTHISGSLIYIL